MATEALNGRIDLTVEDGDSIPNPSPLEIIISDDDHKDATAFLGSTNQLLSLLKIVFIVFDDLLLK